MPDINITVAHKVAVSDTQSIVCDNSDYMVHWTLDEEWSAYETKTMRTIYMDGTFEDKAFSGDTIELPVCTVPGAVQIGLFAGNIRASRMAIMRALPSVRSAAGAPADPTPDVYDQLMERMAQLESPDWAQNDPSAKDYVRNRTHYVSRESRAVVPEQEVTTAVQNNFNVAILNNVDSDAVHTLYNSEDDTTLDVVFDGTSYQCKWLEQGGRRIPVFGNLAIADPSGTDTGEPFCVTPGPEDALAIGCKVAGTHTVAVSYQQDVVHTLDPKYIKDMYYSTSEEKNIAGVQIIGTPYEGTEHDPLPFALGQVWNAKFVTTHYNDLEVKQDDDGTLYIGDMTVNNPPFYVSVTSGGCNKDWIRMMQPGVLTLTGVSGTMVDTTIHPIPEQYIPDTVVRKSDIPEQVQSDWGEYNESSKAFIKNKPQVFKKYLFVVTPDATEVVMPGSDALLWYDLIEISLTEGSTFSVVTFRREGSYSAPIYSQKTGQPVTKEELPYFDMVCTVINVGGYPTLLLINPR